MCNIYLYILLIHTSAANIKYTHFSIKDVVIWNSFKYINWNVKEKAYKLLVAAEYLNSLA